MSEYAPVLNLGSLDGTNGFRMTGLDTLSLLGYSVSSAGDINNDGYADLVVGAPYFDVNGVFGQGAAYVVMGSGDGFDADFDVTDVDGENGFRLNGIGVEIGDGELSAAGFVVNSAGDINGDGFDDVMVASQLGLSGVNGPTLFVLYGRAGGFLASRDLGTINGTNGVRLEGPANASGTSTAGSAGDVNNDGFDDLVIAIDANNSYVAFGKAGMDAATSAFDMDGTNGFRVNDGGAAAGAGDVNGDGFDDVMVGDAVIFGAASGFAADVDTALLDGLDGFRFILPYSSSIDVSSAGDINGDGLDDMIVGSRSNDLAYVVFGKSTAFAATIDVATLNGTNGFVMNAQTDSYSGETVSSIGDFNGDGFGDLLVAGSAGGVGPGELAGVTYVLFGKASGFTAAVDLTALDGDDGMRIEGEYGLERSGYSASGAGDVNGDGLADIIVGAPFASNGGYEEAGAAYVVFGAVPGEAVKRTGTDIGQAIFGGAFDDKLTGLGGDDTLTGNGGADKLIGGTGSDGLIGGGGIDILTGGKGGDILNGGGAADTFIYKTLADSTGTGNRADHIQNLNAADTIDLSAIDANSGAGGNQAFVLAAAFTGVAGQLVRTYIAGQNHTLFQGDTNGDGVADLTIIADGGDFSGFAGFAL